MSGDTLILAAFCVFVVLLGMRMKQRFAEWKRNKGQVSAEDSRKESAIRRWFAGIQLVVLGGLLVYMIPALFRDLRSPDEGNMVNLILRCLIFVFTIYILIWGTIQTCRRKDKENVEK